MPALERRYLPPSLSAVASKGRRLFSRDSASGGVEDKPSALNLNEALEQGWSAAASPHCLSNQLRSPPLPSATHVSRGGKDFGRRRSSNATTTSTSSDGLANDGVQRRRKSLFSKKARSELPSERELDERAAWGAERFIDPFAQRGFQQDQDSLDLSCGNGRIAERSSQRFSTQRQEQQKRAALERVSDLVCLAVENQMAMSNQPTAPSSPEFQSPSSTLFDTLSYQDASTSWPTIADTPAEASATGGTLPMQSSAQRMARITSSEGLDVADAASCSMSPSLSVMSTADSYATGPSLATWDTLAEPMLAQVGGLTVPWSAEDSMFHHQILLPSSMKRMPSATARIDAGQRSYASLKAQTGHGFESKPYPREPCKSRAYSPPPPEWTGLTDGCASLPLPPPLRPSRNPLRKRSKSLSATEARRQAKDAHDRAASPPPPLPSPPPQVERADEVAMQSQCAFAFMQTPPRSRRSSEHRPRFARCDSLTSAASSGSLNAAPFRTPTFGSQSWSSLPVA